MNKSFSRLALGLQIAFSLGRIEAQTNGVAPFVSSAPLEFQLFAREPDIIDPVAVCFDENGRAYVVEMRDYPLGLGPDHHPGSVIRLLEDRDDDGVADRSTIFAEGLSFATSVTPWRGGILVTAPPDIVYLKDTDGDGRADTREVWFTGFNRGVTDSNVNGLRWGLDNRVHGLNGGNGGSIRKPGGDNSNTLELEDADFSFDPRTRSIIRTYQTSGGFGLAFDDWGHSFSTYNINHVQQRVIPLAYAGRFPGTPAMPLTVSISDHEDMARIYPVSVAATRVNHPEQAGYFSSAGGIHFLSIPGWPGNIGGSLTVADVVGNLIHRDILTGDGSTFRARRAVTEVEREFIASPDPACRPIALENGPDGALYLLDMQRDVIEHPDYIPAKMKARLNLRAGEDRGRIYRVHPRGGWKPDRTSLALADAQGLVEALGSSNAWRRITAQRLLIERHDKSAVPALRHRAGDGQPALARLHALWTLEGLGALTTGEIESGLRSEEAGLRENAIKLAEIHLPLAPQLAPALLRLTRDPSAAVRLQLALTLGNVKAALAESALTALAKADADDKWIRWATLSSLRGSPVARLESLLRDPTWLHSQGSGRGETLELTAAVVGARRLDGEIDLTRLEQLLLAAPTATLGPVLRGLEAGQIQAEKPLLMRRAAEFLGRAFATDNDEILLAAWPLQRRWGLPEAPKQKEALAVATARAQDPAASQDVRQKAIQLLGLTDFNAAAPVLWKVLEESDAVLQRAVLEAIRRFTQPDIATGLVARWTALLPSNRPLVVSFLLSRTAFHNALIGALESGGIQIGELNLDLEQRRTLLREGAPDIRRRAAKFMADEEYSNRKTIVDDWLARLPVSGEPAKGLPIFERTCAPCHAAGGVGRHVGPDLNSVAHRSVEDLLSNILDPNMAINPAYITFRADLLTGESETGLLQSQTPGSVTLLQALELKTVLPRAQIKALKSTGRSLMPEGLEAGMSPRDLRDLIAFLQGHP